MTTKKIYGPWIDPNSEPAGNWERRFADDLPTDPRATPLVDLVTPQMVAERTLPHYPTELVRHRPDPNDGRLEELDNALRPTRVDPF